MPTQVKLPTGEIIEVKIDYTTTTVDGIKKEIEKRYPAYPAALQALFFDVEELADEDKTLEEINHDQGRRLVMTLKPKLTIILAPITLEFKEFEEIAELKRRVSAALSITPNRLKLTCNGSSLADQKGITVEGEGIEQGCEIHADVLPEDMINITVRTLTGRFIGLQSFASQTPRDVKESLTHVLGVRRDCMRLFFMGRELEDTKTLAAVGIKDGSFIYISTGFRGGFWLKLIDSFNTLLLVLSYGGGT